MISDNNATKNYSVLMLNSILFVRSLIRTSTGPKFCSVYSNIGALEIKYEHKHTRNLNIFSKGSLL